MNIFCFSLKLFSKLKMNIFFKSQIMYKIQFDLIFLYSLDMQPDSWWSSFVSLFNVIHGFFTNKDIFVEERQWYYLTKSWSGEKWSGSGIPFPRVSQIIEWWKILLLLFIKFCLVWHMASGGWFTVQNLLSGHSSLYWTGSILLCFNDILLW